MWCPLPDDLEEHAKLVERQTRHLPDADRELRVASARFYVEHFTRLDEATAGDGSVGPDGARQARDAGLTAWSCSAYDPVSRLCTAHDTRPPMCRGYPWYEDPPYGDGTPGLRQGAILPPGCSHRWDVPVEDRGELVGRLLPLWPKGDT